MSPYIRIVLIYALTLFSFPAHADSAIGETIQATGNTVALRLNRLFSLRGDHPIFLNDELQTGAASRLHIVFKDKTKLQLGDHSKLLIDELVYDPGKKGNALFTLTQGVFRMVSGALNKMEGSKMVVRTPLATIGIRGTDFWGHQTKEKLIMALLDNGRLDIQTPNGTITLTQPRSAITIEKGKETGAVYFPTPEQIAQAKSTVD